MRLCARFFVVEALLLLRFFVTLPLYNYDETGNHTDSNGQSAPYFIDAASDNVIKHDANYDGSFSQRGNLTSVTQSSVVNGNLAGSRKIKHASFDTNGNLRAEADGAGNRKQFVYTDYYSNKPGGVGQTHAYVNTSADPTGFRNGAQRDYYHGQAVKTFNLTPGSNTEEQVSLLTYDLATDRLYEKTQPDGGWMRNYAWDNWLYTATAQLLDTSQTQWSFTQTDGAGRVRRKANDHPDGISGKYAGQQFVYDHFGDRKDASNRAAIDTGFVPSDEDAAIGWKFTNTSRDELERLKLITRPDGNTIQYDYTGCNCAGSETMIETDEAGCKIATETDVKGPRQPGQRSAQCRRPRR